MTMLKYKSEGINNLINLINLYLNLRIIIL